MKNLVLTQLVMLIMITGCMINSVPQKIKHEIPVSKHYHIIQIELPQIFIEYCLEQYPKDKVLYNECIASQTAEIYEIIQNMQIKDLK